MRYRSAGKLTPDAIGRRVTVRRRLAAGGFSDTVGTLRSLDADAVVVRNRDGDEIRIPFAEIAAARVIEPPSPGRRPG